MKGDFPLFAKQGFISASSPVSSSLWVKTSAMTALETVAVTLATAGSLVVREHRAQDYVIGYQIDCPDVKEWLALGYNKCALMTVTGVTAYGIENQSGLSLVSVYFNNLIRIIRVSSGGAAYGNVIVVGKGMAANVNAEDR